MAGPKLNVRGGQLLATIVAGWVAAHLIAHYVPEEGKWLSWLFILYSSYGLIYGVRGLVRGIKFLRADDSPHISPERVYVIANLRREILRLEAHIMVFLVGVFSLNPSAWFGKFFTAAMFNLVYAMGVNSTLDDTLGVRMRRANQIQAERLAEEAAKELVERDTKRDASRERTRVAKAKRAKRKP